MGYGDDPIPMGDDPIRLAPPVTKAEVYNMVNRALRIIKTAYRGPVWDSDAWVATCKALGVVAVRRLKPGQGAGYYDVTTKVIYIEAAIEDWDVSRRIIHELIHHVLIEYGISPRRRGIERYDDHRFTVEHQAANMGEIKIIREWV